MHDTMATIETIMWSVNDHGGIMKISKSLDCNKPVIIEVITILWGILPCIIIVYTKYNHIGGFLPQYKLLSLHLRCHHRIPQVTAGYRRNLRSPKRLPQVTAVYRRWPKDTAVYRWLPAVYWWCLIYHKFVTILNKWMFGIQGFRLANQSLLYHVVRQRSK